MCRIGTEYQFVGRNYMPVALGQSILGLLILVVDVAGVSAQLYPICAQLEKDLVRNHLGGRLTKPHASWSAEEAFYFPSTTYWKTNRGLLRSATWGRNL
ncbi:hypothetical protein TNCV_1543021 [Trichonephila clavipes]|nr:hypothetical protein TNCV_1543021 [Trichonephila clavipes]